VKETSSAKWTYLDGVAHSEKHPDTFHIPSDKVKAKIEKGYWVKVGFVHPKGNTERLWVYVIERLGDLIRGTIDNDPVLFAKSSLECGQIVTLTVDHVLGILDPQGDPV